MYCIDRPICPKTKGTIFIRVFMVPRIYDFEGNSSVASDDALEAFFGSSKMHCPCTLTRQSALFVIFTQGIHSRQNKAIDEKIAAHRRHHRANFESQELNRWGKKDPTRESQYKSPYLVAHQFGRVESRI